MLPGVQAVIANELRRAAERGSCRLFVAELEGALVGFVFAEIEGGAAPGGEPPPAWVHELWVERDFRGRGIAARLLAESDAFFASRGVTRVSVRVESSNAPALEFWSRRGFGERARILERGP